MDSDLIAGVRAFRPFLPAKDFLTSLAFYEALGFQAYRLGDAMAEMSLGSHAFILHHVEEWSGDMTMHVLVDDVQKWWRYIQTRNLVDRFGTPLVHPPRDEPWGLTVLYVADPSEVLWHFAQPIEP